MPAEPCLTACSHTSQNLPMTGQESPTMSLCRSPNKPPPTPFNFLSADLHRRPLRWHQACVGLPVRPYNCRGSASLGPQLTGGLTEVRERFVYLASVQQRSASVIQGGKQINHQYTLQRNSSPCLTVCWISAWWWIWIDWCNFFLHAYNPLFGYTVYINSWINTLDQFSSLWKVFYLS